jgi:hypothetical protein
MIAPAGERCFAGTLLAARISGTTIDAIAELLLDRADLGQQGDRIERTILSRSRFFTAAGRLRMRQRPPQGVDGA